MPEDVHHLLRKPVVSPVHRPDHAGLQQFPPSAVLEEAVLCPTGAVNVPVSTFVPPLATPRTQKEEANAWIFSASAVVGHGR